MGCKYSVGWRDFRELFKGLEVEGNPKFREHLNKYDVIYLNMQQFLIGAKHREITEYLEEEVLEEIRLTSGTV